MIFSYYLTRIYRISKPDTLPVDKMIQFYAKKQNTKVNMLISTLQNGWEMGSYWNNYHNTILNQKHGFEPWEDKWYKNWVVSRMKLN
jgi:hypothetical protein